MAKTGKGKKILSALVALCVLFAMSFTALVPQQAQAAASYKLSYTSTGISYTSHTSSSGIKNLKYQKYKINGKLAWCVEKDKEAHRGSSYTKTNSIAGISSDLKKELAYIANIGYNSNKKRDSDAWFATVQQIMWDKLRGKPHNKGYTIKNSIPGYSAKKKVILDELADMKAVKKKKVSFAGANKKAAYDDKTTFNFTDKNGVLSKGYKVTKTTGGVTAKISGNKLTVNVSKKASVNNTKGVVTLTWTPNTPKVNDSQDFYCPSSQNMFSAGGNIKPITVTVTITKGDHGKGKVQKVRDNANASSKYYPLSGIVFTVYESDKKTVAATLKTDANGNTPATDDLPVGTYWIKETSNPATSGMATNPNMVQMKIQKNKTKKVKFTNNVLKSTVNIVKTLSADSNGGSVQGFKFIITNNDTKQTWERVTDANGNINIPGLLAGSYTVREVLTTQQIMDHYKSMTNPVTFELKPGTTQKITWTNKREVAQGIVIKKTTTDGGPLGGFKFKVTGPQSGEFTTDASGMINLRNVKPGVYTITEVLSDAQKLRYKQPASQTKEVKEGDDAVVVFEFTNQDISYPVKLVKTSNDGKVQGIKFTLTGKSVFGEDVNITKLTDAKGNIDFGRVHAGSYTVEETGFDSSKYENTYKVDGKNNPTQKIEIPAGTEDGKTYSVTFKNKRKTYLIISKVDGDTGEYLEGAEFDLQNSKGEVVANFTVERNEKGSPTAKIIKALPGIEGMSEADVPEEFSDGGTIIFGEEDDSLKDADENKAEREKEDKESAENDNKSSGDQSSADNAGNASDKQDSSEGQNTGDNQGSSSSDAGSGEATEKEDTQSSDSDSQMVKEELEYREATVDTVDNTLVPIEGKEIAESSENVNKIAFEYAIIKGLEPNEEYTLIEKKAPRRYLPLTNPVKFKYEDMAQLAVVNYLPEIGTTAIDKDTKDHISRASDNITINDEVAYKNLNTDVEYTLKGTFMNKDTGKPLTDDDGKEIVSEVKFTPKEREGKVNVPFNIKGSDLAGDKGVVYEKLLYEGNEITSHEDLDSGDQTIVFPNIGTTANIGADKVIIDQVDYVNLIPKKEYKMVGWLVNKETGEEIEGTRTEKSFTPDKEDGSMTIEFNAIEIDADQIVVFEECYLGNTLIGDHKDINDDRQTVDTPKIGTRAQDAKTNTNVGVVGEKTVIIDSVEYKNLVAGKEYTVRGILMDKETGEAILDKDGKEITGTSTFTPVKNNETFEVPDDADDEVADETSEIANDADKDASSDSGEQSGNQTDDQEDEDDGTPGTVIDVEDEESANAEKSNQQAAETEATTNDGEATDNADAPQYVSGTVEVKFEFDSELLKGKSVVVFEDAYYKDLKIATHADINDEGQTINYPDAKTKAQDAKTENGVGTVGKKETIMDTVSYTNLVPGKEYTVKGTLMDKETGKAIAEDGKEVSSEAKFTPSEKDGTVEMKFTLNSETLKGKSVVVFEDIYLGDVKVVSHADINDEEQTVDYNDLKTTATVNGMHTVISDKPVVIKDKVAYKNLTIGKEYTIKGTLMDESTGKPISMNGKKVTASKTFTAKAVNGSETLKFKVNAKALQGKTTVVFEDLYHNSVKIGTHSDLKDKAQTVAFKKVPVILKSLGAKTDDDTVIWVFGVMIALSMLGSVAIIKVKR